MTPVSRIYKSCFFTEKGLLPGFVLQQPLFTFLQNSAHIV